MERVALIGFGEAAQAFALTLVGRLSAYDLKLDQPAMRTAKLRELAAMNVAVGATPGDALREAVAVLSLVTADQALAAAEAATGLLPQALWFDMNSVAPDTKRAAAALITRRGGRYVDVAVMAPVYPLATAVPLLVSGEHADAGATMLRQLGFRDVTVAPGDVGTASAIKLIRSIMVKGVEALSAECALAAEAAGVRDAVIRSLDASWPGADWTRRLDYNLDRMMIHGERRAAEMDEAVRMLDSLGTGAAMSTATASLQRQIGGRGLAAPTGLRAKLSTLLNRAVRARAA